MRLTTCGSFETVIDSQYFPNGFSADVPIFRVGPCGCSCGDTSAQTIFVSPVHFGSRHVNSHKGSPRSITSRTLASGLIRLLVGVSQCLSIISLPRGVDIC